MAMEKMTIFSMIQFLGPSKMLLFLVATKRLLPRHRGVLVRHALRLSCRAHHARQDIQVGPQIGRAGAQGTEIHGFEGPDLDLRNGILHVAWKIWNVGKIFRWSGLEWFQGKRQSRVFCGRTDITRCMLALLSQDWGYLQIPAGWSWCSRKILILLQARILAPKTNRDQPG